MEKVVKIEPNCVVKWEKRNCHKSFNTVLGSFGAPTWLENRPSPG
jgi:hypothetical protein